MPDEEMTKFLDGVIGVVEANSYERMCLWDHAQQRKRMWESRLDGLSVTVGAVDSRPICVTLMTAVVDGQKILFLDPTSALVDHFMIDKWLVETLPATALRDGGRYANKVDAMNFHNVFRR